MAIQKLDSSVALYADCHGGLSSVSLRAILARIRELVRFCNAYARFVAWMRMCPQRFVTKTISLTQEAYDRLRARKGPNESFSDVILRLTARRPLAESAGLLSKASVRAIREAIEETRQERQRKVRAQRKWGSEAFLRTDETSFSDDKP